MNGIDLRLNNKESWIPCHTCTCRSNGGSRGRSSQHMRPKKRKGPPLTKNFSGNQCKKSIQSIYAMGCEDIHEGSSVSCRTALQIHRGKVTEKTKTTLKLNDKEHLRFPCSSCELSSKGGSRGRRTRRMRPKKRKGTYHRRR